MSDLYAELRGRLRRGMDKHGLSQGEVARRSGVDQGNISRILSGQRPCTTLATWDKLLDAVQW